MLKSVVRELKSCVGEVSSTTTTKNSWRSEIAFARNLAHIGVAPRHDARQLGVTYKGRDELYDE